MGHHPSFWKTTPEGVSSPNALGSCALQGSVLLIADATNCRKERSSLLFKRLIAEMLLRTTLQKGHFVTELDGFNKQSTPGLPQKAIS